MDDAALAGSISSGDDRAFEALVRRDAGRVLAVASRLLGPGDDASQAVRGAFVSAFKARHDVTPETNLTKWLHEHAIAATLHVLSTRPRHPEDTIDDLLPRYLPSGAHVEHFRPWRAQPGDAATMTALVQEALTHVPESFRVVLLLSDVEGYSIDQIASMLHTKPNPVRIRLHRARMALRRQLAPDLEEATS